jgi:hypothetical protein
VTASMACNSSHKYYHVSFLLLRREKLAVLYI